MPMQEIFGPVMSILKFSTVDEAIRRANQSSYGDAPHHPTPPERACARSGITAGGG